jgi:anhydro-N-acetylmuramic acid kinase
MSSNKKYVLGLMSGTSADGVSIAAITVKPFRVIACKTYPYSGELQAAIISAPQLDAHGLSLLNFSLGKIFAEKTVLFLKEHHIAAKDVEVAGSHGQTICHYPQEKLPHTFQLGEPSFIAEMAGIPVVSDFRPRDMAAGGEGAPLVPFMDEYLFGGGKPKLLQNIGGIGNVAVAGKGIKTFGFDTGPGNCLMDDAVAQYTKSKMTFDRNGKFAAAGTPDKKLVEKWLKLPFFAQKPPKSLDRAQFNRVFLRSNFKGINSSNINNVLSTLNYFTAAAIAQSVKRFIMPKAKAVEMIVSGGGALNPVLMRNIADLLSPIKVAASSAYGLDELAKEPACFALMAHLAYNGKTNHCPQATGAAGKRILGKITPA